MITLSSPAALVPKLVPKSMLEIKKLPLGVINHLQYCKYSPFSSCPRKAQTTIDNYNAKQMRSNTVNGG